ncbi:unnamed protein product [Effrenium voratum]|nr:unnamed protein product [Effrenium voratum]
MLQPGDRQVQQRSMQDPFGMFDMQPFGGGGFGGLFGSMFGQMNQMMQVDAASERSHVWEMERMGPGFPGAVMNSGNGGSFSCQTFSFSSRMGPDGQMHTEQFASSAVRDRRRDMHEVQQAYSNSSTGVDKMSLERQLEGRARKTVKERTRGTMEERQTDMFRGMDEADAADFDSQWQQRAAPSLPRHQGFARMLGDARGPGRQMSRDYGRQQALPSGYDDTGAGYEGYEGYGGYGGYGGYAPQRTPGRVQGGPASAQPRPARQW